MGDGSRLDGRRILITGAAGGMGRAIATRFAGEGAAVALLDRNGAGVAKVASELGAWSAGCDVSHADEVAVAVAAATATMGGLDGVVNAAGVYVAKPFEDLEAASVEMMLAVNLMGPFHIIRAALPELRKAPGATVVNVASVSGFLPMAGTSGYSASKAGLLMLTKCLALELGPTIRVNAIAPGVICTEMTRHIWENPEHAQRAADRVALKQLGQPEHIAQAALYLTSEDSGFTTGTEVTVDGGFSWR